VGFYPNSEEPILEELIDMKYGRPDTSGITVNVDASTKVFDFQVDRFRGR
jgi:hypothetical protein